MFYFFNIQILLLRYYEFAIFILFFVKKDIINIFFLYKIIQLHILNILYLHILYKYKFPSFYRF